MRRLRNLAYSKSFSAERHCRVFLGEDKESWNRCAAETRLGFRDLLLLPADANPFEYRWPVRDLDVLVFNAREAINTARLEKILLACLNGGSPLVVALIPGDVLVARP